MLNLRRILLMQYWNTFCKLKEFLAAVIIPPLQTGCEVIPSSWDTLKKTLTFVFDLVLQMDEVYSVMYTMSERVFFHVQSQQGGRFNGWLFVEWIKESIKGAESMWQ